MNIKSQSAVQLTISRRPSVTTNIFIKMQSKKDFQTAAESIADKIPSSVLDTTQSDTLNPCVDTNSLIFCCKPVICSAKQMLLSF